MSLLAPTYSVIPLSIQDEGDCFMVGSQDLGDYYQFPGEGVAIIGMLREGASVDAIKARAANEFAEAVDVDDFLATLLAIGFIAPEGQPVPPAPPTANFHDADRRIRFSMRMETARWFISAPAVALYAGVIACAAWAMVSDPRTRPNLQAFYLEKNLTLTLLALLVLQTLTTVLHECGHMIAAASQGIHSRLGIGNRIWNIVAEADLSGIFSLPKRRRYFPLLAGMLVDLFSISCITLWIGQLVQHHSSPALVAILQALVLQVIITLSWQFNLFLRTDLYYVICDIANYPTLDGDARIYIADKIFRITGGRAGQCAPADAFPRKRAVRMFAALWIAGRIGAIAFLLGIILPTLLRYLADAWHAMHGTGASQYDALDVAAFALLAVILTGGGVAFWITNKLKLVKERRHARSNA